MISLIVPSAPVFCARRRITAQRAPYVDHGHRLWSALEYFVSAWRRGKFARAEIMHFYENGALAQVPIEEDKGIISALTNALLCCCDVVGGVGTQRRCRNGAKKRLSKWYAVAKTDGLGEAVTVVDRWRRQWIWKL
ncbi:hypothetical protein L596_027389 [Steinernema carpocapsae]|uniref:Uncharacterized protein n=1 Tax=Steinernema carpocapsae TaxID=34508 RepID=A0A4U5M474_STECR|nr:hypothetical protein L596_027389 [Steinernema carpocapsae]